MAAAIVACLTAVAGPAAAGDAGAERDAVRDQQARLADELDVLQASDREVATALDQLDAAVAVQQAAHAAALVAVDEAVAAERRAEAELRIARRDVAALEQAIVEMAVASYVHPPTADLVQSLQAASLSDALKQQVFLAARAQRDLDLLHLLEDAEARAATRADELAAATEAAAAAVAAADAELARLDTERQRQADFAADLQGRIDGALAEAAALAELDAELSARIVAEQQALLARLPPVPAPPAPGAADAPEGSTAPAPAPAGAPSAPADQIAAPPSSPSPRPAPAPRPPASVTRPRTPAPPLATVRGFTVHAEIADELEAMLAAAEADGITFGGSAYRSTQRQIELRVANCGPTEYDVWYRPASSCSPPTAVPGRSLHEQGRALDLTYDGALITSRANVGFQWLAANASTFGFFNLPSEPWHFSTTGA